MLPRLVTIAAGLWLVFAPVLLGYGDPAQAQDRIVGPVIAGSAFVAIWEVVRPVRWVAIPFALWLLVVPLILGYPPAAMISSIAVGVITLVTTPLGKGDPSRFGGGWKELWKPARG